MKRICLALLVVISVLSSCSSLVSTMKRPDKIVKTVDSFDGSVRYDAIITAPSNQANAYISVIYYQDSDIYNLFVFYNDQNWIFMEDLDISADGDIFTLSLYNSKTEIVTVGVKETAQIPITRSQMALMANSTNLKFRIQGSKGSALLEPSYDGFQSLKDLLALSSESESTSTLSAYNSKTEVETTSPQTMIPARFIVLGGEKIYVEEAGGIVSWVGREYPYGSKILVEVGYFKKNSIGFILFDGSNEGEFSFYQRQGMDHRWDWGPLGNEYAFIINPDGTGAYYDFTRSSIVKPSQLYQCEQR